MKHAGYKEFIYFKIQNDIHSLKDDLVELCMLLTDYEGGAEVVRMEDSHLRLEAVDAELHTVWRRHT